ncbi:hypothetical protein LDENG_00193360 [Lucifuga dentata]|nr:hypothetical protein LDENG_00193360 [Lucifuga dentata]
MESIKYQEILGENVMLSVRKLKLGRHWTFQQDNYPKHASKSKWLSQSPDLNPIENLWWDLKKAVEACKPKNINELEAIAHEEWAKIPEERCQKLVSGYASHLQQVITAKGCSAKY